MGEVNAGNPPVEAWLKKIPAAGQLSMADKLSDHGQSRPGINNLACIVSLYCVSSEGQTDPSSVLII